MADINTAVAITTYITWQSTPQGSMEKPRFGSFHQCDFKTIKRSPVRRYSSSVESLHSLSLEPSSGRSYLHPID